MWIADNWKDYEVLDTSSGEKLERWGDYILVRPDPQVIWKTPHDHKGWKQKNGHYHRSAKGGGEWEFFHLPDEWAIHYTLPFQKEASGKADPLTFHLKPFSFKHTGLFPEQAVNWDWFSGLIHEAGRPVKVLNFLINSYTTGLQPAVLSYMMNSTLTKKFGGHVEAGEIGLPVTESGLVLPCGASGRWQRD